MGALLDQFAADGVCIEASFDGTLHASGKLTDAVRAAIRANKPALLEELAANEADGDPDVASRRTRALAILGEHPEQRIAVIAEAGDPAHVTVAVRGVAVADMEIAADRYDAFALLALMQQYGHA